MGKPGEVSGAVNALSASCAHGVCEGGKLAVAGGSPWACFWFREGTPVSGLSPRAVHRRALCLAF